jgi:prepilin-type N-terminal cleavage/methylation domain-containing protein
MPHRLPRRSLHKLMRGFTLIELLVVVAIIGILAAIAVPNYNDYITRSKITEAVASLSDLRVRMEQYYQDNRYYNTDGSAATACAPNVFVPPGTAANTINETANFTFTCTSPAASNGQTYTWTATGRSSMLNFTYTINQSNARTSTIAANAAWPAAAANCWITNKNGGC